MIPDNNYERPDGIYPGAKVKFLNEKKPYTVICSSRRYTICTKPFNLEHTVLYTIIDWKDKVRGPEDLIFGLGAETKEQCLEMLVRLTDGYPECSEVSHRHRVPLDIEKLWYNDHVIIGDGSEGFMEYISRTGHDMTERRKGKIYTPSRKNNDER